MQFVLVGNLPSDVLESGRYPNIKQLLEEEKAHARKAYLEGSIRQMWLQSPGLGAVAIIEANSLEDAERLGKGFPLAKAGLLDVKIIGIVPYTGFGEP
jgi:uncharacterized protein YciI